MVGGGRETTYAITAQSTHARVKRRSQSSGRELAVSGSPTLAQLFPLCDLRFSNNQAAHKGRETQIIYLT